MVSRLSYDRLAGNQLRGDGRRINPCWSAERLASRSHLSKCANLLTALRQRGQEMVRYGTSGEKGEKGGIDSELYEL